MTYLYSGVPPCENKQNQPSRAVFFQGRKWQWTGTCTAPPSYSTALSYYGTENTVRVAAGKKMIKTLGNVSHHLRPCGRVLAHPSAEESELEFALEERCPESTQPHIHSRGTRGSRGRGFADGPLDPPSLQHRDTRTALPLQTRSGAAC